VYGKLVHLFDKRLGGGAGVTHYIKVPCPTGYERHILWLCAYHNDGAAGRMLGFLYRDKANGNEEFKHGYYCDDYDTSNPQQANRLPLGFGRYGLIADIVYDYQLPVSFILNDNFELEVFGTAVAVDKYFYYMGQAIDVPNNSELMILEKTTGKWYPLRSRE